MSGPHTGDRSPIECNEYADQTRGILKNEGFVPLSVKTATGMWSTELTIFSGGWTKFDLPARQATVVCVEVTHVPGVPKSRAVLKMRHWKFALNDLRVSPSGCDDLIDDLRDKFLNPDRKVYTPESPKPQKGKLARWFDRILGR